MARSHDLQVPGMWLNSELYICTLANEVYEGPYFNNQDAKLINHKGSGGWVKKSRECKDELQWNTVSEQERSAFVSIPFHIYAALFVLSKLVPHIFAQITAA